VHDDQFGQLAAGSAIPVRAEHLPQPAREPAGRIDPERGSVRRCPVELARKLAVGLAMGLAMGLASSSGWRIARRFATWDVHAAIMPKPGDPRACMPE
jgi:hypothetical protein